MKSHTQTGQTSSLTDTIERTTLSPRLAALKKDVMERKGSWVRNLNPFFWDVALWKAAKPGQSRIQQRAAFLRELVRLAQTIETAIAMKVGQLQWNVTTVERLRQAQADPEHYGNIPVRVAGYSQLFKLVNRELQDHIIARTKHTS